ncbi:MAG: 2-oxoacid:acceptor oxidoreductase family protein [Candidatus Diapherotrites archaeon]|nr:2-oxoacid:acceptor oxidoreductase family protein [Candidatus Diapherotrites archaeon]
MSEIRFHGRAGQGMVTAAKVLAVAVSFEGKHSQAFPLFGSEKRGPPVVSFCRVSDKAIDFIEEIDEPNIVVVADASVLDEVDVTKGMKKNGLILINSKKSEEELRKKFKSNNVFSIDATSLAVKYLGKPITNTVMLGALAKVTGMVSLKSIIEGMKIRMKKLSPEVFQKNVELVKKCYDETEARK